MLYLFNLLVSALTPTYAAPMTTIMWWFALGVTVAFLPFWAYSSICLRLRRGNNRENLRNCAFTGIGWTISLVLVVTMSLFQLIWANHLFDYLMPRTMAVSLFTLSLAVVFAITALTGIVSCLRHYNYDYKTIFDYIKKLENIKFWTTTIWVIIAVFMMVIGLLIKYQWARWIGAGLVVLVILGLMFIRIINKMDRKKKEKRHAAIQAEHRQLLAKLLKIETDYGEILNIEVLYLIHHQLRQRSGEGFLQLRIDPADAPTCWLVKVTTYNDGTHYQLGWRENRLWSIVRRLGDNWTKLRDFAGHDQLVRIDRGEAQLLEFVTKHEGAQSYRRWYMNELFNLALKESRRLADIRKLIQKLRKLAVMSDEELDCCFETTDQPDFGLTAVEEEHASLAP